MLGSLWFASFSSGAGAAGDYELISTSVLGSAQSSVVFSTSSYSGTYKHLQLRVTARSTNSGTGNDGLWLQLNSDTTSNYSWHRMEGNGSTATTSSGPGTTWMLQGLAARASQASGIFSGSVIDIVDAFNTTKNKICRSLNGSMTSANPSIAINSGIWFSTNAITTITLKPDAGFNFDVGSRFSLYGLRG